jgi:hypothetical protein
MASLIPEVKHDPRGLDKLIPTSKRMKQIRENQDSGKSGPMKSFPRTRDSIIGIDELVSSSDLIVSF